MDSEPIFHINTIPIMGKSILAPMDGFSDHPFRFLCRKMGSAASFSEFINGIDIKNGHPFLGTRLFFSDEERPFGYQILENQPERLQIAANFLQDRGPDFIDFNLGCSSKQVCSRGAGAALLKDTNLLKELLRSLTSVLQIPFTAKIRLGWDSSTINFCEVAKIIQDYGGKCITLHARTRQQGYEGFSDWTKIAELKNNLDIPVIGNGDVKSPGDIQQMISATGCNAVMIGRQALNNPWIFRDQDLNNVPELEKKAFIMHHLDMMLSFYGSRRGLILFRKYLVHYLQPYPLSSEDRIALLRTEDYYEFMKFFNSVFLME